MNSTSVIITPPIGWWFSAPSTVVVKIYVRNVWDQYTLRKNPSLDILGVHNRGRTSGNCVENS